ncbi:PD40 domain-containing protein [Haliangium ochraceum]|uniref:Periplasmic component of the Tol biopolymer transport system-like protein n=1 Tax=Haliangium ochraceum (strain DSM 14365 / JCM 11303 / SMP-2) TaxID=502025 RepID=D0LY63_HALO1|nr:PD40 domain-containing protein [Haliangium ochraceum]ACY16213.1 Periplasmic component of the Tol biopolymer transport system-like protein [Haliangium ochraceum DSM 14365]
MHDFNPRAALSIGAVALCFAAGCSEESAPGRTYYDRNVEPILLQTCASNVSGCHAANDDDPFAFAAGNFDVTSFENVQKRRDLLEPFGVYPVPLLLIKSTGASDELEFAYGGEFQSLRVQHAGGTVLEVGSEAYLTLLRWMENGATESGLPPVTPPESGSGGCSNIIAQDFDPAPYVADASFNQFVAEVQPVLVNSCATGNCHGAPQSDFYVTCGDSEQARAYNFAQVQAFVDEPAENSPLLLYPLAVSAGGYFHTGGEFFGSRNNGDYKALASWAEAAGAVDFGADDAGKAFFADYVQPMLLRRGCQFEACHSPAATNDFKLRSGSQGFFSAVALEKNYELARKDFMSMEVPDARRSRIASKTMLRSSGGIAHRGGPLLEDARLDSKVADISSACAAFAPEDAPPLCILQQWVELERQDAIDAGAILPLAAGDTVPLVYVERETEHVATPLEFDTYQPGSDLLVADATLDERGAITALSEPRSLLAGCPGAGDTASVDVRAPDLRHDGTTIAFAMRTAQSDPLGVYKVNIDGGGCQRLTPAEAPVGGIAIHNFDPAWSPDGASIVFASTRGGANAPSLSRQLFLPQSDIWRMRADGSAPEQVTYLTNSELSPQMIREGRIILSTEKVSSGFYQVAGRRINWDRTDYHPLLAQRAESPFVDLDDLDEFAPSVGYAQATDIREALNGNFLFILSDAGARGGAGTLAVFNRSVGTFEAGREQAGYLESMSIPDTAATGRAGSATQGAYRTPYPLLDGRVLVSYASFSGDLATANALDWDLVAVDPRTGAREVLLDSDKALVDAVLAVPYEPRELYFNRRQLVFGGGVDTQATGGEGFSIIHFPDAPVVFTLLNANLRRGRPVDTFREASHLAVYREAPAPAGTTSGSGEGGIFEQRELLGRAALAADGSVRIRVPAGVGVILELQTEDGGAVETMREEHQVGPGEVVSIGVPGDLFDGVCGGCHGSISGQELDATLSPDVLTGASESIAADNAPVDLTR